MIKLGKNGEIIAMNGFNRGTYQPKSAFGTNVYLGETSKEDIAIKKQVKRREQAARKIDADNFARAKLEARRKMQLEDYRKAKKQASLRKFQVLNDRAHSRQMQTALLSGMVIQADKFMGSPFAGFGDAEQAALEQRIDPDSETIVDIVDSGMQEVDAYGVKSWMENATSEYNNEIIEDELQSYTPGRVNMATMVDYATKVDQSLVSFPKTLVEMTDAQRAEYAAIMERTGNSNATQIDPKLIKYALYGLAAYLLLK